MQAGGHSPDQRLGTRRHGGTNALTIGVVGLGNMGGPIARVLAGTGWPVVGWDLFPQAGAALAGSGVTVVDTTAELGSHAEIVLTSLPDARAVRAVALGEGGLTSARSSGLLVDLSTTAPDEAVQLKADLAERGWSFIDAPVSGGVGAAAAGTLTIMAGADDDDLERARPVLEAISHKVVHCGPVGAGQVAKACNQLIVMATISAVAEVMVLARAAGLDPAAVREALLSGLAASPILDAHGGRMLRRDFEPGGMVKYNRKDIATIRRLGAEHHLALPVFDAAAGQVERVIDGWGGDVDNSAVVLVVERDAGIDASAGATAEG